MPAYPAKCRRLLPAGLLAVCLLLAPLAAQVPSGITKVTSVEGITEYHLENGLRIVLFPDPTKTNATVNITYMVGSRH
jgi:zinc protease